MNRFRGLVLLLVLALVTVTCALGLDANQICPARIETPSGTYFITCSLTVDAGADAANDTAGEADVAVIRDAAGTMQDADASGGDAGPDAFESAVEARIDTGTRDVAGDGDSPREANAPAIDAAPL